MMKTGFPASMAIIALLAACPTHAQGKPPLLGDMAALHEGTAALDAAFGRQDGAVGGPDFDAATGVWHMDFFRRHGSTERRFEVTLDEASGRVCVKDKPGSECAATGDASTALQAARDTLRAQADAASDPPPDLQGVMVALIRQQLVGNGYLATNRKPLYVSIKLPDSDKRIDISPASIESLRDTGLQIMPGSAWQTPSPYSRTNELMNMHVGTPLRRSDGDYEVTYGFYCGQRCSSFHTAVLRHDASGWHVLSSVMDSIS